MESLGELKKIKEDKMSEFFKKYGVFFAFSDEQFQNGKTALKSGEKYVSMGMGGYIPQSNLDSFLDDMEALNEWFKNKINSDKETRKNHISYELSNHEAYYTGQIDDTLAALGSDYTAKEVWKVYNNQSVAEIEINP